MSFDDRHPRVSSLLEVLKTTAIVIGAVSLLISFRQFQLARTGLIANVDWNRRSYAGHILENWQRDTGEHRAAIELAFPGINDNEGAELTRDRAEEIYLYLRKPETAEENLKLHDHLVALLNHMEYVSSCYENDVADRRIIERSLKGLLVRWYRSLRNFNEVVSKYRGYSVWEPYVSLVKTWDAEVPHPLPPVLGRLSP